VGYNEYDWLSVKTFPDQRHLGSSGNSYRFNDVRLSSSSSSLNRGVRNKHHLGMKRDEWMTDGFLKEKDRRLQQQTTPGTHGRELNPYWERGDGTPNERTNAASSPTTVNPWLKMKVKRTLESIESGETSLEKAAIERFGTLRDFEDLCRRCGFKLPTVRSSTQASAIFDTEDVREEEKRAEANEKMMKYLKKKKQKGEQEECKYCSPQNVLSEADYTFLAVPEKPINSLHFVIVPKCHEESTIDCDASVLNEVRNYKKSLIRLYAAADCLPIFIELRRRVGDQRQHVHIECFGIPSSDMDLSIYFRKALSEAESYWATHKAIIECPDGLARALPRRPFPIIHVDLWTESFAHIIEDDRCFPSDWPSNTTCKLIGEHSLQPVSFAPFDWHASYDD